MTKWNFLRNLESVCGGDFSAVLSKTVVFCAENNEHFDIVCPEICQNNRHGASV